MVIKFETKLVCFYESLKIKEKENMKKEKKQQQKKKKMGKIRRR